MFLAYLIEGDISKEAFFLWFGLFNVCLAVCNKPLSLLVLKFFAFGDKLGKGDEIKEEAKRIKLEGLFDNPEIFNPSRKTARIFLLWTGVINSLGLACLYIVTSY